MRRWHFYDLATGLFSGRVVLSDGGPRSTRETPLPGGGTETIDVPGFDVPEGMGVVELSGRVDIAKRKIDTETGQVVSHQPQGPADDELKTWAWDESAERWVASPTLLALKAAKMAEMKAARDAQQYGGFTWDGSVFDSDPRSQTVLLGMFTTAALGGLPDTSFRLKDNTWRVITSADMLSIWATFQALVAESFDQFEARETAVFAAASIAEVEAISWPA